MNRSQKLDCGTVDDLAAAFGLGALDAAEGRAVREHFASCRQPHAEARELIETVEVLPMTLQSITPSAGLRARVMTSVAAALQDHHAPTPEAVPGARPWWSFRSLPATVAAVALIAAVGAGAWGASLNSRLNEQQAEVAQLDADLAARDDLLQAVASADAAYRVTGDAGSGWVIESGGQAMFMADDLSVLPVDRHYALWLVHADGTIVRAGAVTDTEGVTVATLEQQLTGAVTFSVTVEEHVVEAPSGEPVLTAQLGA